MSSAWVHLYLALHSFWPKSWLVKFVIHALKAGSNLNCARAKLKSTGLNTKTDLYLARVLKNDFSCLYSNLKGGESWMKKNKALPCFILGIAFQNNFQFNVHLSQMKPLCNVTSATCKCKLPVEYHIIKNVVNLMFYLNYLLC